MQTINEYREQANKFLSETGTEFKAEFLRNGKYFDDDKEARDIYEITLTRGKRSYTFTFGASIIDSGFYYTIGVNKYPIDRKELNNVNIKSYVKKKDYRWMNGINKIHFPVKPDAYTVLSCVTKYEPGTFEDFCSEFEYDTDSRKAEKIYNAVKDEYLNIARLFNQEELEKLIEIQ